MQGALACTPPGMHESVRWCIARVHQPPAHWLLPSFLPGQVTSGRAHSRGVDGYPRGHIQTAVLQEFGPFPHAGARTIRCCQCDAGCVFGVTAWPPAPCVSASVHQCEALLLLLGVTPAFLPSTHTHAQHPQHSDKHGGAHDPAGVHLDGHHPYTRTLCTVTQPRQTYCWAARLHMHAAAAHAIRCQRRQLNGARTPIDTTNVQTQHERGGRGGKGRGARQGGLGV